MKPKNHFSSIVVILALMLSIQGCSTRQFAVRSVPEGSLVIMGSVTDQLGYSRVVCGTSPVTKKVNFIGKNAGYYIKTMARGYETDSIIVTKNSEPEVMVKMKRIESYKAEPEPSEYLKNADFYLMPVNTNIILHKGVGNLDRYERSDELSREAADSINKKLKTIGLTDHQQYISYEYFPDLSEWNKSSNILSEYLLKLKAELLMYYPLPPAIPENDLRLMTSLLDAYHLSPLIDTTGKLLVYIWCKSIKPTTGRIAGNIAANLASGVVQGIGMTSYSYDPNAFNIDSSTLWIIFVIEPEKGRIIHISQHTMPFDITKPANRDKLVTILANLPQLINNQNDEK